MAQWIYEKPVEDCNDHECKVAKLLESLPDSYLIRWGFYYIDNDGVTREGDFLVLGPDGHLLLIEVKKRISHTSSTGRWAGDDGSSPVEQVLVEKSSVLAALTKLGKTDRDKYFLPFIEAVLVGWENLPSDSKPAGLEPEQVWYEGHRWGSVAGKWNEVFSSARPCKSPEGARRLFLDCYGGTVGGVAAKRGLAQTEKQLLRLVTLEYALLDQLDENRVLLMQGGPGSGKSWMAMEAAIREARQDRQVLFLCYNLDFAAETRHAVAKLTAKTTPEAITVWSWQDLVNDITGQAELALSEPSDRHKKKSFFAETVPQAMLDAATSGKVSPRFDVLVVDEAQDHDTRSLHGVSWWEIYLALIRDRERARIRIFYDAAQRPAFRDLDGGKFIPDDLLTHFPGATRVQLLKTLRYTDGIATYLRSLEGAMTSPLATRIQVGHDLPGPPPIIEVADAYPIALANAGACIKRWITEVGVDPRDILVLTRQRPFDGEEPLLNRDHKLGGQKVISVGEPQMSKPPYAIRCTSFHKSKGLDAQAVVLLDTWPFEELSDDDQFAYFLAASRARQLLAVFPHKKKT